MRLRGLLLLMALGLVTVLRVTSAIAHHSSQHTPEQLREVNFEQRLGASLPLHLTFRDESGQTVRLGIILAAHR